MSASASDGPLPFASRAFDLMHCLFVMHFKVPDRTLRELRRCTAEHGYLLKDTSSTSFND